jgi:hypothetical protein
VLFGYNTTLEYVEYYDPIAEDWEPVAPPINELNDIGDVDITTPADGDLLVYDDGDWINQALASAQLPTGSILQVVSTTKTDTFSSTSGTFTDVTGLTVSITPSSTASKVLVTFSAMVGADFGAINPFLRLARDGTGILIGDAAGSRTRATDGRTNPLNSSSSYRASGIFLDSPNTTSAITYSVQVLRDAGGTFYINRTASDADNANIARGASTITVMEVAG